MFLYDKKVAYENYYEGWRREIVRRRYGEEYVLPGPEWADGRVDYDGTENIIKAINYYNKGCRYYYQI